jgi:metal-dependent amidase/aminoacylase/carboxypeptidase family protein
VVLVFQACEEGEFSGARLMVGDGLMDEIDIILGMHVENWLEHGTIGICPGAAMAASHPIHIEFFGKTAHATLPQSGVNALAMAGTTYNGIQPCWERAWTRSASMSAAWGC